MSQSSFSVGDYINNRYLILDKFTGTMGLAYLIEDVERPPTTNTPSRMIAKTLHPDLASDSLYDQFLDEASVWINLKHKLNIVHAYKVESIDGIPFVFAEFIRRGILPNALDEWIHYRLTSVEVALYFAVQILDGLWYVYQDDVELHGDLKPSNILLDEDFTVKLNDWGFARSTRKLLTADEARLYARYHGSSAYIAPEAMASPPDITRALDGFAVGVILGEMLTGERFRAGATKEEVAGKLSKACFGFPEPALASLSQIVAELLTPDVSQRLNFYQNHARHIAEIFMEATGINVIDDSAAIIIEALLPGHGDRLRDSSATIDGMRKSSQSKLREE